VYTLLVSGAHRAPLNNRTYNQIVPASVVDPDPGSGAFLTPDPGSGAFLTPGSGIREE
jgi:hypothetical protein